MTNLPLQRNSTDPSLAVPAPPAVPAAPAMVSEPPCGPSSRAATMTGPPLVPCTSHPVPATPTAWYVPTERGSRENPFGPEVTRSSAAFTATMERSARCGPPINKTCPDPEWFPAGTTHRSDREANPASSRRLCKRTSVAFASSNRCKWL